MHQCHQGDFEDFKHDAQYCITCFDAFYKTMSPEEEMAYGWAIYKDAKITKLLVFSHGSDTSHSGTYKSFDCMNEYYASRIEQLEHWSQFGNFC